jgi:hypothetical protein
MRRIRLLRLLLSRLLSRLTANTIDSSRSKGILKDRLRMKQRMVLGSCMLLGVMRVVEGDVAVGGLVD